MKKLYCVKHELHGKQYTCLVKAPSELDAIIQARGAIKDNCNVSHIISISLVLQPREKETNKICSAK